MLILMFVYYNFNSFLLKYEEENYIFLENPWGAFSFDRKYDKFC